MTSDESFFANINQDRVEVTSGDDLLRRAQEILAVQLSQLRGLAEEANRKVEETSQERRNLSVDREEINYRLRFLDSQKEPGTKKEKNSAQLQEKRRQNLLETQQVIEKRDRYLETLLVDLNDASKRLNLLLRQLEIAGSQLVRQQPPVAGDNIEAGEENAWEVALRAQLIQGQEEERKRLAREIHDGPAQVLANAAMQLDFVGQLVQKDRANAISELTSLRSVMRESLAEVRRFMFNLQPKMLAEQGLSPTLQHYCNDFANQYGLVIEINLPDFSNMLTPNQELAAFRVVQEALNNIRKHAVATKVVVSGSRTPEGKVLLSVIDDGRGFNPGNKDPDINRGAGLPGMQERAELIGAKLKINSRPGYGTEISLLI
jgi:two-component system sensor histidine kinase DegS